MANPSDDKPARSPLADYPSWKRSFAMVRFSALHPTTRPEELARRSQRLWFRLNLSRSRETGQLLVDLCDQRTKKKGGWDDELRHQAHSLPDPLATYAEDEAELLSILHATASTLRAQMSIAGRHSSYQPYPWSSFVPPLMVPSVVPRLCATGRFFVDGSSRGDDRRSLDWDPGPPWRFGLRLVHFPQEERFTLAGTLRRGEETRRLDEAGLVTAGAVLFDQTFAAFEPEGHLAWVWLLREGEIPASEAQVEAMLEDLWTLPSVPEVEMPPEWELERHSSRPRPRLVVLAPRTGRVKSFRAYVAFDYDGAKIWAEDARTHILDLPRRRLLRRDAAAEADDLDRLAELGATAPEDPEANWTVEIPAEALAAAAIELHFAGWLVEAEGRRIRPPGTLKLYVSSGIDWFDLRADVDFEGVSLLLPELLTALRENLRLVRLGDGTCGILPEEWIERYTALARFTAEAEGALRFSPADVFFLETLLEGADVEVDSHFAELRERLRSFERLRPMREPPGFQGELRPYQREGLAWLRFLEDTGLGGCLADDMGLGKTVQLLALFEDRRRDGRRAGPSLIVVPKSLVHNWIEEAGRFTPGLKVLGYSGPGRSVWRERLQDYDLVVTTYGALRRDVDELSAAGFDYVVLDEAQAIKNAASKTARACRALPARHRLALTGTPVENHLGELGSIFAFLNPGLLDRVPGLGALAGRPSLDEVSLDVLRRALKPFLLRRTKEAVLPDLPEKTEQVLYCELEGKARRHYEELRDHYRVRLDRKIEELGMEKARFQVLEALLRLRQAACHPALIDATREREKSAKLEIVLGRLQQVLDEGHKALVFSQFVKFLTLLRRQLDRRKVTYEYLDGSTHDRKERVERFQNDEDCRLFLISLKAGGVGLNLTAADYVFLLDPWWNPAVEAQAVDRAHRIGQRRPVFAYRLICRETVEEKILRLQERKRELAEAVVTADESLVRTLSADDLRWLLS